MKINTTNLKHFFYYAIFGIVIISSCNNSDKKAVDKKTATDSTAISNVTTAQNNSTVDSLKSTFDIATIPVSNKEIGAFPYLKAPDQYKFNDISKSDLQTVHFAINGKLVAVEGKTYSTNIYKLQESGSPFNVQLVKRNYDQIIKELGGVQVSSSLLPDQIQKVGQKILEAEGDHAYTIIGTNDFTLSHVNTYIIRTAKVTVWIELSFYENGGYIYILEKENS
jgi:OOP family OmpA-OmpF porin